MEWEAEDKAKALAWKLEDSLRCSMCGTSDWEWTEDRFAYEPMVKQCHGCYLKDITAEDTHNVPGSSVVLVPPSSVTNEQREAQMRFLAEAQEEHFQREHRGLG